MQKENYIPLYKVEVDFFNGHLIVNKKTGNCYNITGSELYEYMQYAKTQIKENMSFNNALKHIDDYLHNIII